MVKHFGREKIAAEGADVVPLLPDAEQRSKLRKWLGTVRWTYNRCVEMCCPRPRLSRRQVRKRMARRARRRRNNPNVSSQPKKEKKKPRLWYRTAKYMRDRVVSDAAFECKADLQWVLETPQNVRDGAVREMESDIRGKIKRGEFHAYMKYRSRKDRINSFRVPGRDWNRKERSAYFWLREIRSTDGRIVDRDSDYEVIISCDRSGHFFAHFPRPIAQAPSIWEPRGFDNYNNVEARYRDHVGGVLSIDPGIRTFLTGYDPSGRVIEFAKGDFHRIETLCEHADDLQSRIDILRNSGEVRSIPDYRRRRMRGPSRSEITEDGRKKRTRVRTDARLRTGEDTSGRVGIFTGRKRKKKIRRMRRALLRAYARIRHIVNDVHRRAAKWITLNYRYVFIPIFETSRMVRRHPRRVISSKTARNMMTWSHYRFRQTLLYSAKKHPWCTVHIVSESYTTKTCGVCGELTNIECSKIFKCSNKSCGACADRDFNASRNILLRVISGADERPAPA